MIVFYGKGKVGTAFQELYEYLGKICILMDDEDRSDDILTKAEIIVPTPGIRQTHDIYKLFGDKITSELDMCQCIMDEQGIKPYSIGITGTDGKSTVTRLIAETLRQLLPHNPIHITGNFDEPMGKTILHILQNKQQSLPHIFVIECSSFMLYPTKIYAFNCGIRTNFASDHLNRHPNMEEYFSAKQRLFIGSVCNFTSQEVFDQLPAAVQAKTHVYGTNYDITKTHFVGQHNEKNCALAFDVVRHVLDTLPGVGSYTHDEIHKAIRTIKPLKHRMQVVEIINGVTWYDDGKSTSAQSLGAALQSFHEPLVVICGGSDKGDSFGHLAPLFKAYTVYGVFLGQTAPQFVRMFETLEIPYAVGHSMRECVSLAKDAASNHGGSVILFSPGCASLDMFKNYEDRANQYLEAISQIL